MRLKPRSERKATPEQVMAELRPQFDKIPGVQVFMNNPPLIRIGGQQSRAVYQFTLQSQDLKELYSASESFTKMMQKLPGLTDVNSDLLINSPEVILDIDRDRASALGVTADQVEAALMTPTARGRSRTSTRPPTIIR